MKRLALALTVLVVAGCAGREQRMATGVTVAACQEAACSTTEEQRMALRIQLHACDRALMVGCPTPVPVPTPAE